MQADRLQQHRLPWPGNTVKFPKGDEMNYSRRYFSRSRLLFTLACLLLLSGCSSIGPRTVSTDSFDYTRELADSWKQRMLINMVRLRYGDTPIFLDVASVINQYSMETRGQASVEWQTPLIDNANTLGFGGSATFTDRPTITYIPLSGEKFARSLMRPLPPSAVLGMIEAGYPVDVVLRVCVESINGIRNRFDAPLRDQAASPEFYPLLERLRRIQSAGSISMRVQRTADKETTVFAMKGDPDAAVNEDALFVRKTLGLDPAEEEFRVAYGSKSRDSKELAILTRSILQIMNNLASAIEVPETHVTAKQVKMTSPEITPAGTTLAPLIRIHSSATKPDSAFVAVPYESHWFWIDNRDLHSKGTFSFMMFLFSLTETGGKEGAPVVTISAGG
jgi:hypothetical protein